jgi:hypothetical protein
MQGAIHGALGHIGELCDSVNAGSCHLRVGRLSCCISTVIALSFRPAEFLLTMV